MDDDIIRSKSYNKNNMQLEVYGNNSNKASSLEFRSYSTSYVSSSVYEQSNYNNIYGQPKLKKGKSTSSGWGLMNDPELQRKKRVASYKVYAVEGKVKGSFRKSVRWIKDRYTQVVYGWW